MKWGNQSTSARLLHLHWGNALVGAFLPGFLALGALFLSADVVIANPAIRETILPAISESGSVGESEGLPNFTPANFSEKAPANWVISQEQYVGPSILPAPADAVAGGNPFQGLGRPDDPGQVRTNAFGFPTYNGTTYDTNVPSTYSSSWANYGSPLSGGGVGQSSTVTGQMPAGQTQSFGSSSGAESTGPGAGGQESSFVPTSSLDLNQSGTNSRNPGTTLLPTSTANPPGGLFTPGFAGQAGFGENSSTPAASLSNQQTGTGSSSSLFTPSSNNAAAPNQANGQNPTAAPGNQSSQGQEPGFKGLDKTLDAQTPQLPQIIKQIQRGAAKATSQNSSTSGTATSADENEIMSDSSNEDDLTFNPISSTRAPDKFSKTSGLGLALSQLRSRDYRSSIETIQHVLKSDPGNANAHYLMAVNFVLIKNFPQARQEYENTLKFSRNNELSARARLGLSKLGR